MILQNNKQKAFTIVELLIVIVVIGILAAISIVSYNGIQNRARDTSVKNSASQVRTKIEAWNSIRGSYPAPGGASPVAESVRGGLVASDVQEARIDSEVVAKIVPDGGSLTSDHSPAGTNTIQIAECVSGSTITGYTITYLQKQTSNGVMTIGTGC